MTISGFTPIKAPPYNLYLAPCDFFLFNNIKEKPRNTVRDDEEKPCIAIRGLVIAIPGDLLLNVLSE
jgi:hypothetical protein